MQSPGGFHFPHLFSIPTEIFSCVLQLEGKCYCSPTFWLTIFFMMSFNMIFKFFYLKCNYIIPLYSFLPPTLPTPTTYSCQSDGLFFFIIVAPTCVWLWVYSSYWFWFCCLCVWFQNSQLNIRWLIGGSSLRDTNFSSFSSYLLLFRSKRNDREATSMILQQYGCLMMCWELGSSKLFSKALMYGEATPFPKQWICLEETVMAHGQVLGGAEASYPKTSNFFLSS